MDVTIEIQLLRENELPTVPTPCYVIGENGKDIREVLDGDRTTVSLVYPTFVPIRNDFPGTLAETLEWVSGRVGELKASAERKGFSAPAIAVVHMTPAIWNETSHFLSVRVGISLLLKGSSMPDQERRERDLVALRFAGDMTEFMFASDPEAYGRLVGAAKEALEKEFSGTPISDDQADAVARRVVSAIKGP